MTLKLVLTAKRRQAKAATENQGRKVIDGAEGGLFNFTADARMVQKSNYEEGGILLCLS